jgi:hypothetical protein
MNPEAAGEGERARSGWRVTDHDGHVVYRGTDPDLANDLYQALRGGHLQQFPSRAPRAELPE